MEIRKINIKTVEEIYEKYIVDDFPINERRPLDKIIMLINENKYDTYALFQNDTIIGYAFFYGIDNRYICDYFAIVKDYRQMNYGSYFLQECLNKFNDKYLYFEVEKPEEPDKEIKEKRIHFYLKNGLLLNNIQINLYFVEYLILSNKPTNLKLVKELYKDLYEPRFYKKYIKFENEN